MKCESNISCECSLVEHRPKLVVLTGGPGAGKTAVLELARRGFCQHILVLPESASIVFGGGFPRSESIEGKKGSQRAIFHVQNELESVAIGERKAAVVLCDRGTIDGLAYWPGQEEEYWRETGSSRAREMAKYAAVFHLRTPGVSGGYNRRNPIRIESADEAVLMDQRIAEAWSGHPNRHFVESAESFLAKAACAIELIRGELPECCRTHSVPEASE